MLNLPSHPGAVGLALLVVGAVIGLLVLTLVRGPTERELRARLPAALLAGFVSLTVAGAPFIVWRVFEDIRETAPVTPDHARFVGAETKLIDGELVERLAELIPRDATYYVAVAPDAYVEIRESLAHWAGYALVPRRQTSSPRGAEWIVTWGATPEQLGLHARDPQLVGRNRLVEREPVYVAAAP